MGFFLLAGLFAAAAGVSFMFDDDGDPTTPARPANTPPRGGGTDDGAAAPIGTDGPDEMTLSGSGVTHALGGNDILTAGDRATVHGDTGRDILALSDRSTGYGGYGDDVFQAEDDSAAHGGIGNDSLLATDRATAHGDAGDDRLNISDDATAYGGDGKDNLFRQDDADSDETSRLYGGAGDDSLWGLASAGDDIEFHGDAGNDTLLARDGIHAFGGSGNDLLFAETGGILTGGAGGDLFLVNSLDAGFAPDPGDTVTITDFLRGQDRLQIDLNGPPSALRLTDDGTDTTLSIAWEATEPTGFETGPVNSTIILRGVTGMTLDDITFTRASANALVQGQTPDPTDGTYGDIRIGTAGGDRLALSGDQPLVLAGDGADTVTGAAFDRRALVTLGAGDDSFIDGGGVAIVHGGAGNDSYSSDATTARPIDRPDVFYGGDGNDSATLTGLQPGGTGGYSLSMGAGNDRVTVGAGIAEGVRIEDGSGDDTIRGWMGTSVTGGAGNDQITFGIDIDHVTAGRAPAMVANLGATDRLILEIDGALTGALTAHRIEFDPVTETGPLTELRIGGLAVARVDEGGFALDDPRLTVTRGMAFA